MEDLNGARILRWKPPNPDKGKILNYKLVIVGNELANNEIPQVYNRTANISLLELNDLYYCRTYTATISAFTYLGEGTRKSIDVTMGHPQFKLLSNKGKHKENVVAILAIPV